MHYSDRNFTTGTRGLIAVDKKGNEVLFLDPQLYNVIASIKGFALLMFTIRESWIQNHPQPRER